MKIAGIERTLELCFSTSSISEQLRQLYESKLTALQEDRSLLPQPFSVDAPPEVSAPTPLPNLLTPLATLNMLVVSAPKAGTSTLLGNLLYDMGRLPFSLVKPKKLWPGYWEQFNGQQLRQVHGPPSSASTSATSPSSAEAVASLTAWNARHYNYANYTHCFYTHRYRINVLHPNMGGISQPSSLAAAGTVSSSKPSSPQHTNLQLLAALQADFVLLVVDGSSGSQLHVTPSMQQQLLVAQQVGVRNIIVAITQLDSGSAPFSEKRFQAILAQVISSCLKPLGFTPAQISALPVSGRSGENVLRRTSVELSAWYRGVTLIQQIDKLPLPPHRQVESLAERKVCLMVKERPVIKRSILNEDTIEAVSVAVHVMSGVMLHAEPVGVLSASVASVPGASRASMLPLGPVHLRSIEREEKNDARDVAIYENENEEGQGQDEASMSTSTSSSSANSSTTVPDRKLTHAPDGRKLTNAERKQMQADAKREHARMEKKKKKLANQGGKWIMHEHDEEDEKQTRAVSSSNAVSPPRTSVTSSFVPTPCLTVGENGVLTLSAMSVPSTNTDDALQTMLSGRDEAQLLVTHSQHLLHKLASQLHPGDMIVHAAESHETIRFVTGFKAEVLALSCWPADVQIKVGSAVTMVPLRGDLPSPASITDHSPPSLVSMLRQPPSDSLPLGSAPIIVERILSVLHKSNRSVARKKPEYLTATPPPDPSSSSSSFTSSMYKGGDLSVVEFSCRPAILDTLNHAGPKLATMLLVTQDQIIALATVTHVLNYA